MNPKIKFYFYNILTIIVSIAIIQYLLTLVSLSGFVHSLIVLILVFIFLWWIITIVWTGETATEEELELSVDQSFKFRVKRKWLILPILALTIYGVVVVSKTAKTLYNKSVVYYKQYEQKTNALNGFYDNMWKTYSAKDHIAWLNKTTFVEVTKIIMEARKDGENVAWKWLTENQQIPYEQFTSFYRDLSTFIEGQRAGYYALETERQNIAMAHNMMMDTFPHTLYNLVLKRKIEYKYGFLSDSTNKVFETGVENVHYSKEQSVELPKEKVETPKSNSETKPPELNILPIKVNR